MKNLPKGVRELSVDRKSIACSGLRAAYLSLALGALRRSGSSVDTATTVAELLGNAKTITHDLLIAVAKQGRKLAKCTNCAVAGVSAYWPGAKDLHGNRLLVQSHAGPEAACRLDRVYLSAPS
jgi:hypothetical protein